MVGNIGSGKSTLTKKYQKKGYVVISLDEIRKAIGGGKYTFNTKFESTIFSIGYYMFKRFCIKGANIVIDETSITKNIRSKYIKYAKKYGYYITAIVLPEISQEKSVTRRLNNPHGNFSKTIWKQVWSRFNICYEKPNKKEGFDKIIKKRI